MTVVGVNAVRHNPERNLTSGLTELSDDCDVHHSKMNKSMRRVSQVATMVVFTERTTVYGYGTWKTCVLSL